MQRAVIPHGHNQTLDVRCDSLIPCQQPTRLGLKKACSLHTQVMIKHPHLSFFHSYAELLYAGLLEGDPTVISYTPQPYKLWLKRKPYIPDVYIARSDSLPTVVELKPRGEMDEHKVALLTRYFDEYNMRFIVASNEECFDRHTEAANWLEICRNLHLARDMDTQAEELALLEKLAINEELTLDEIIDRGDRERTYYQEIACFRCLHRGRIQTDLTRGPLDFDNVFTRCR